MPPVCICASAEDRCLINDVWSALSGRQPHSHSVTLPGAVVWSEICQARRTQPSTTPDNQLWAITLLSLSSQTTKAGEELEWEGNGMISTLSREGKVGFKAQAFLSLPPLPKMSLLYNLASPDLGLGKTMRAFLRRVGLSRGIIVECRWTWSCRQRNAFSP